MTTSPHKSSSHRAHSRAGYKATGVIAVSALLLSGCGGGQGDDDSVELQLGFWGAENRVENTEEIVAAFEEANPGVSIEVSFSDWGGYWDRLTTQSAGGDAPDIMQFSNPYLREYAERGTLLPLDQVETASIDESVVDSGVVDGEMYGVPVGVNIMAIAANETLFEEAGVEIPNDETWTWEEMGDAAAAVAEETGVYGMGAPIQEATFEIWLRQVDKGITDADGEVAFEPEDATEYFQMLLDFEEQGVLPPASVISEQNSGTLDQLLIRNNEAALGMEWNAGFGLLTEASGESEFEILRFPSRTGEAENNGLYNNVSMFFSASANTEHPEEAQAFIDFMVNSEEAGEINLIERGFPANTEIREMVLPELEGADRRAAEFLNDVTPELGEPRPITPLGFEPILDEIYNHELGVLFGDMTPEEAGESLHSTVQELITSAQ